MKKFEPQQSQLPLNTDDGWLVQVYGRDRRLLCVLDPSHGWLFLLGLGVGVLLTVIWVNVARYSPPAELTEPQEVPELRID
ncbi:hypothetical protein C7271_03675 [filamentous cyanobacterium CCP5]|nr:hypothetical protein C7271_03675 [filamentous cyanobacterium CCP5]